MIEKPKYEKEIHDWAGRLSECCQDFILLTGTEKAPATRLEYAREINTFFDYLISYTAYFSDKAKDQISVEDLKHISSKEISRYLTFFKDKGRSERTLARKRAALSSFFTYCVDNRILEHNPIDAAAKVKVHKQDVIFLDTREQLKLLDDVESGNKLTGKQLAYHDRYKQRDYALIYMLLDTGMRVSELHGIDIGDIDFENCCVVVRRKGGNQQTLYFSDDTKELLLAYIESRKEKETIVSSTPLFVTLKGERLGIRAIEIMVKKYAISSIPGRKITPHKMRSSFAMEYFAAEKDLLALQRALGHKNLTTVQKYAEAQDEQMKNTRSAVADRKRDHLDTITL